MKPVVKRPRTHTLVIEIPVCIDAGDNLDYEPMWVALNLAMSISKLAIDGVVCDDARVTLRDVLPNVEQPVVERVGKSPVSSPRQLLATLLLGCPVMDYIQGLRNSGMSLDKIAAKLSEDTDGKVVVTYETIRLWFLGSSQDGET